MESRAGFANTKFKFLRPFLCLNGQVNSKLLTLWVKNKKSPENSEEKLRKLSNYSWINISFYALYKQQKYVDNSIFT